MTGRDNPTSDANPFEAVVCTTEYTVVEAQERVLIVTGSQVSDLVNKVSLPFIFIPRTLYRVVFLTFVNVSGG